MAISHSINTTLMVFCFGSAGLLISATLPQLKLKQLTPEISQVLPATSRLTIARLGKDKTLTKTSSVYPELAPLSSEKTASDLVEPQVTPKRLKSKIPKVLPVSSYLTDAIAAITYQVVVDLSDTTVYLYWGEQLLQSHPIAIGKPGWDTPTGSFKIIRKQPNPIWKEPITGELIPPGPDNPLGERWIGFWSDGHHQIGLHGTDEEELIGTAVSHGCLRMLNQDIKQLYEQVSLGTPVIVRN
ncbi:L,D-transpeptidase [Moorena sp. SIO3H5]|uniref:L,D-transpeptidase n=1 Tax=Moorena sp. SIO3H5 TaxID=2607834 RepID=UPI0025FD993A|nr:L,D-transpeptidase [Moorena sp. SIO3H5]